MTSNHKHSRETGDDVAALIRLAGRRSAVPEERIDRARAAAHATWRREIHRRTRTRYIWGTVALAAAASLAFFLVLQGLPVETPPPPGIGGSISLQLASGAVQVEEPVRAGIGGSRPLQASDTVPPRSVLVTADTVLAALSLPSGHSLRLDRSTRVRLVDSETLALERGTLYIDSGGPAGGDGSLMVETSFGRIREIGTQFEARVMEEALRVRVREGAIVLHHDDEADEVSLGTEITVNSDGSFSTRQIPIHGEEWKWVSEITPMLALEGRTAREFLDWAAREGGWELAFGDDTVARSAETIQVTGEIDGMTMEQALDAVLLSCGMSHRISEGRLQVEAVP